jgi:hypothetical protein
MKRMLVRRRGWTGGGRQKGIQFWMVLLPAIQNNIFLLRVFCRRKNVALMLIVVWSHSI